MFQVDRLQTEIQERDLARSQQETEFHSQLADREEELSRLKADINIQYERIAQNEGQVSLKQKFGEKEFLRMRFLSVLSRNRLLLLRSMGCASNVYVGGQG
jgi:uncharacterized protein YicC (UPF0701 family)